jgi:hypothetical protein
VIFTLASVAMQRISSAMKVSFTSAYGKYKENKKTCMGNKELEIEN